MSNNNDPINRQIDQAAAIARIEVMVEQMHSRLFGNGQPGEIDKIKEDIDDLKSSRTWFKGVVATLTALVSFEGGIHIKTLLK